MVSDARIASIFRPGVLKVAAGPGVLEVAPGAVPHDRRHDDAGDHADHEQSDPSAHNGEYPAPASEAANRAARYA